MPRVQEVIIIEAPEPPAPRTRKRPRSSVELAKKKAALDASPTGFVIDSYYKGASDPKKAVQSARNAAYQVNSGNRKEWPGDKYYGVYRPSPDDASVFQLAIGLREYMNPKWVEFVSRARSRKGSTKAESDLPSHIEDIDVPVEEDIDDVDIDVLS